MLEINNEPTGNRPIVVVDSGVGGLSVLAALQAMIARQAWHYIADNLYVPYGEKSASWIIARCQKFAYYAHTARAKALVMACNTATAAAAQVLRCDYPDLMLIGIEPAVKPAVIQTRTGVVGVLATASTLASDKFNDLVKNFSPNTRIALQPCPGLAEGVEAGDINSGPLLSLLRSYVTRLLEQGADVLVLGCTHYAFLRHHIEAMAGPDVLILETGEAVARETARRLQGAGLAAKVSKPGITVLASGEIEPLRFAMQRLTPDLQVSKFLDLQW